MRVELEQVNARGTAVMGVVSALKPAFDKAPDKFPRELWYYFERPVLPDRWYKLPDYLALMRILAAAIDPKTVKGDPFRAFGIIGAQRDLRSIEDNVPEAQRPGQVGVYQDFMKSTLGLSARVRRGLSLRERYYSRGYYKVKRVAPRVIEATLHEFPESAELCAVSTGYLIEAFRAADMGAWVDRVSCRGEGDRDCRWQIRFDDGIDVTSLADFE